MQLIAISRANECARLAGPIFGSTARALVCALLVFGLGGAQIAIADCAPVNVPTIDSRSLTPASYQKGDENNFILNRIGIMYARGRGVPKSSRLAAKLFRQLAMDGYTPAMVNLGTLYERGIAGRRDHRQAYAWIRAALALSVPQADYDTTLFKLGMIAARLGIAHTRLAERRALMIIENIAQRCERAEHPYEDIAALSLR
jgi:Sel1 repeat-containing protein